MRTDAFARAPDRRALEIGIARLEPEGRERAVGGERDAIRQELEARGKWDPPWARAPPQSVAPATGSEDPIDPSSPHLLAVESTHPESDPWDDEWVPDPWADAEGAEHDPEIARSDDLDD